MSAGRKGRELTGRTVLIITLSAFGVVIAVNLTMAWFAVSGFPGLVAKNPYVEAQAFDGRAKARRALGWSFASDWEDGRLSVAVTGADGAPEPGLSLRATVGRPATDAEDRVIPLADVGGAHVAAAPLAPGVWRLEIEAVRTGDGASWTIVDQVRVPGQAP